LRNHEAAVLSPRGRTVNVTVAVAGYVSGGSLFPGVDNSGNGTVMSGTTLNVQAIEALTRDLEELDASTAQAVIDEARRSARSHLLRQQLSDGEASGDPLDGPATMAELLAEADADIKAMN
jgi:hypothetical protein